LMYVGLDVHKRACYGTITDQEGTIYKQGKFASSPEGVTTFIENYSLLIIVMLLYR